MQLSLFGGSIKVSAWAGIRTCRPSTTAAPGVEMTRADELDVPDVRRYRVVR